MLTCSVFLGKHLIKRRVQEGRKSFDKWYYIATCATPCQGFHPNQKQLMFFQNILKSKARDQSNQARKKLFCLMIVKIIWATFDESFWSKFKACGDAKSKNRHASWLQYTVVRLSEAATRGVAYENNSY